MANYSIKDLETLSGVKAHTIRIWEKRYQLFDPIRTDTNIRIYSDQDLKKLLNVALLNQQGYKISKITAMSEKEIHQTIDDISSSQHSYQPYINQLVEATLNLDEDGFVKSLNSTVKKIGFETTVVEVLYPLLNQVGILWQTHKITPAHEHLISNCIRNRIIFETEQLKFVKNDANSVLLFLPEHEQHEMGLLFYNYLLRKNGVPSIYLGSAVPYNDLKEVYAVRPFTRAIFALITTMTTEDCQAYINALSTDFKDVEFHISGKTAFGLEPKLELPKNFQLLDSLSEIQSTIKNWST